MPVELPSGREEDTRRAVEQALKNDEQRRSQNNLISGLVIGTALALIVWWNGGATGWIVGSFVFGLLAPFGNR